MSDIVWFRRDLRLDDNPAWASADGSTITALWVFEPRLWDSAGPFRRAQLASHLRALDTGLRDRGGRLRIEVGDPTEVLAQVSVQTRATRVHINRDVTPHSCRRDAEVATRLAAGGIHVDGHWGTMGHRPGSILTGSGSVSRVFTPFHRRWAATPWDDWPEGSPTHVLDDEGSGWSSIGEHDGEPPAEGGEVAADHRLAAFSLLADDYLTTRDRPSGEGTSHLSADLRFGVLSPRHVATVIGSGSAGRAAFARQLAWRDWYAHLLLELPHLRGHAMKPAMDTIVWRNDPAEISAWKRGLTGYPLVDAGMRELAATGFMHGRARMVCASFLVKHLLVDWRVGERWFRRLLTDGDVAQNVGNWQWCAGTGPDAAPYFRVFNPVIQSRKFDGDGRYLRRWVPELGALDRRAIHAPWEAGPLELAAAGIILGEDYPHPIVDHHVARDRVLAAYSSARATPEKTPADGLASNG